MLPRISSFGLSSCALHSPLKCYPFVVFPQMFLRGHHFERSVLLLPNRSDVKQHLGTPFTLLGLMWLEQKNGRST